MCRIGTDLNGGAHGNVSECWRVHILEKLKSRLKNVDIDLSAYEKAIERYSETVAEFQNKRFNKKSFQIILD